MRYFKTTMSDTSGILEAFPQSGIVKPDPENEVEKYEKILKIMKPNVAPTNYLV